MDPANPANTSSQLDRVALRKSITARDFYEDGAGTLLPNSFAPRHRKKPSHALDEALQYRRRVKQERQDALEASRAHTLKIECSCSPERIAYDVQHASDERDEAIMVGKFMRGEHWIVDDADIQRKQLDREERLHRESAKVIADSAVMQQDFQDHHLGKVVIPDDTDAENGEKERQTDYIYKINGRSSLFDMYKSCLVETMRLQDCCNIQEEEALQLLEQLEKGRKTHDFQWQLERNNRVKALRAKTVVDSEDLDHAKMRVRSLRKEIDFKYPEMATALLFEEENDLDMTENDDEVESDKFRDSGKAVYCWIIGRLTHDGKICCILFGQFNRDVQPPSDEWIYIGKNFDRNLVTTSTLSDESIAESQGALSNGGVTSIAESDHVMTEVDMLPAKNDIMKVTPVTVPDNSFKAMTHQKPSETFTYYVSGSSIDKVNGRYLEFGSACNVAKYRNLRGWSIYRVSLMEIPDLGILAENCYSALKGPSISVALDKKSDRAFAEIVDRTNDIKDGTVQFKRRFAEMSRSGQRIINTDQTSQLYRNEQLRAEARSESDRMMMMILQAVSHSKSDAGDVEGNDVNNFHQQSRRTSLAPLKVIDKQQDEDAETATQVSGKDSFRSNPTIRSKTSKSSVSGAHPVRHKKSKTTGTIASTATSDSETLMKNHGVISGVDLDIKVTLSKGIHYQTGSQGFPLARRKDFLSEEAELSSFVTKCIEAREEEVFALRIESEKVTKAYLTSEGLLRDLDTDAIMNDLFRQMRKVREATILTAEALGAWARLCYREKNKGQKLTLYNSDSVVDPKSLRTYCVIIAYKGREIYPQSQEMKSQTGRWTRGLEKAKVSTNFRYIGEYKTMEMALQSFSESASKLLPEQLLAEDSQGARAVVGLRSCGKHFLVRSNAVPNDTPCECCMAKLLAAPDLVVPSAIQDESENLQQFIWHGVNYLEKLWSDIDFLDENILLKSVFPDLDVKYNPLLLLSQDFGDVLNEVTVQDGKVLNYLRGRQEQVRDAVKSGTIISKQFTDHELMGLPYRTKSNQVVDLDKEASVLESEKLLQDEFEKFIKSPDKSPAGLPGVIKLSSDEPTLDDLRPPLPTSPLATVRGMGVGTQTATTTTLMTLAKSTVDEPIPFTPWSSLSPRNALETPEIMGRLLPGSNNSSLVHFTKRAASWLEEDHLDFVGKNRLMRSFHILAQSSTLTKHKLPQAVVPDKLKESVLKRKNILKSTSMPGLLEMATERIAGRKGVLHNDDKVKTVATEVGYFFRGAFFAVPQMRPPPAHRIDDVWCRSDVGEWHGLNKGRSMRSYEFQDNVKLQGRLINEERKRLQMMIRRHIDADIVYTDVPAIKDLIFRSKEIRGSVLALDVIQAEQFLKYRLQLIINIRKMQAMARGTFSRRRVRKMKAELRHAANRLKQVEIESISLSRRLVPSLILDGITVALSKLTMTRFRITLNLSGMVSVLTICKAVRSEKRGFYLCPACNREDIIKVYDRVKKCFRSETAACSCRWWHGEEIWSVKIFDPLSRKDYVTRLTLSQVRKHIELITEAKALMQPEYRQAALVGKSFDRLQALFDASFVTFDGQLEHSNSLGRRRAAEESCILPLVPRLVAEDVLEATRRRAKMNLAIDRILPYGLQFTEGPLTVTAIDHIEDARPLQQWEPIADYEFVHRHVAAVQHHTNVLENRVRITRQTLADCEAILHKHVTKNMEVDKMSYEDSRTTFLRLEENIIMARERIERAMKYQKEGITGFQQEEANTKLDWKQSYDDLEDGNAWEGLNNCRKLEKKRSSTLTHYHNCCAKIPLLYIVRAKLIDEIEQARQKADYAISEAIRYSPTLGQVQEVLEDVVQITRAAVKNSVAVLCMPRKGRWPNQRRVQRIPYRNVFIRDPFVRAQKENISLWNLLERQVMALRPLLKSFTGKAVLRCIVEVYQDPVTKFVMVRINQDEKPVEESMQHIDMHVSKTELSDMTNSALDTDILLRPNDVAVILSKASNWPAVHMKKEAYVFRHIDCFVSHDLLKKAEAAVTSQVPNPGSKVEAVVSVSPPIKSLPEKKEWIPPSKRLRNLDGVKVHPTKGGCFQSMPESYARRRYRLELSEVETARTLMTYLRLHPYTGRPCLGLVHFIRRQKYCVKSVTKCQWFNDLAKGMPSTWTNEILGELRYVGGRLWKVSTRGSLDSLEVRLNAHVKKTCLTIIIPFRDILKTLAINHPILLASLLCETMTNSYSSEFHNKLLDYIDMQLPGEESRRFWRHPFFREMPRLEFQCFQSSKYRGPIFKTHRFFSGRYLEASFRMTANFDFRIELGPPTDGNFWCHVYSGKTIVVDISRDELRAFIAKASMYDFLMPPSYLGNIKILHPHNWLHLFPLLLDVIILPAKAVSDHDAIVLEHAIVDNEDKVIISEEAEITKRLCRKVKYVMEKFNAWALKTKGHCDPLKPEIMTSVLSNIEALNNCMPWSLELKKDDASRKLVEVRSEIWKSRDLRRFYGKYDNSFRDSKEALLSHSGTDSSRHFNRNASVDVGTSGAGANSFWSVRILTDESKVKYFMDLCPVKDTNPSVEIFLAEEEAAKMVQEEEISRKAAVLHSQKSLRCEIAEKIDFIHRKIKVELMPALLTAEKLVSDTKKKLYKIGQLYRDSLDAWFAARASLVYENATVSISLHADKKGSKAKRLLFMPGSFSREPKTIDDPVARMAVTAVIAPKSKRHSLLESGKSLFVPATGKQVALPKNIQITLKKFEKVIASFQSDMSTRTDVDVFLLISNHYSGYTPKRSPRAQITLLDHVEFSSAWYPRYDTALNEVSSNFRSADQWCHYAYAKNPSRTETRVLNVSGLRLLISDPIIGPFDIVGFTLYNPMNSQTWSLVLTGGGDLPKFGHAPKSQKFLKEKEESKKSKDDKKAVILIGDGADLAPIYRLSAERLVWTVVTKATVNVIIASNIEELGQEQGLIEEDIAENLELLESLGKQLSALLGETVEGNLHLPDADQDSSQTSLFSQTSRQGIIDPAVDDKVKGLADLAEEGQHPEVLQVAKGGNKAGGSAIPEIIHHSIQHFRDSGYGIKVYGMMIPADEALDGIPVVVFSQDWLRLCRHYLGRGTLNRRFTTSAFIWSRESDVGLETLNPRANRWIEDYEKNFGWHKDKGAIRRMKKQIKYEAKMHGENHLPYASDVVMLLRYGDQVLPLLTKWLKDCYDEYAPIRELRRQKEGREREFRISNHKKFCDYVFVMASSFLTGIEAMYNERGSINTEVNDKLKHERKAISYYCRVLLSRFLRLRTNADKKFSGCTLDDKADEMLDILDEAFLIDTDFVHPQEDVLLRFDALPVESCLTDRDAILQWDPTAYVLDPLDSPMRNRHDLQPRVGQVVYALYKLHCFECKQSANICKFPGCRCIRLDSAAILLRQTMSSTSSSSSTTPFSSLNDIGALLPELKGTGAHPIERSIRRYLLSGRDLYNQLLPVTLEKSIGVSPDEEIKREETIDMTEAKRLEMIEYLRVTWQELKREGAEFRYICRRVLRPELSSSLCAQDVLEARGGIKMSIDEESVGTSLSEGMGEINEITALIPRPRKPLMAGAESEVKTATTTSPTEVTTTTQVSVTGGLVQIPNSLMLALLGGCGVDSLGRVVPVWAIDPYPSVNSGNYPEVVGGSARKEIQHPMAKPMYEWMVDHLYVSRPPLLPSPASGDRGQMLATTASIKLDRLHCVGTCWLLDGSLVLIQLLYGVLENATLCTDELSGTPQGAIRFCPANLFPDLHRGLTIVAYDMRAGVTLSTALEGRALSRAAEAFEVSDENIPLIACKILKHASMVVRLSRVGEVCTAVAVDVNGVQRQTFFTARNNAVNARVAAVGRKESVFDARMERLSLARRRQTTNDDEVREYL